MSPRSGGEADKFGNRYEGIWTVRQLLEVLHGRARSITVETTGDDGEGVEFVLDIRDGVTQVHQVKRQERNAKSWTLRKLRDKEILAAAEKHIEAGREFHFVSLIPATELRELSDKARRSVDLDHFVQGQLTLRELRTAFDLLGSEIWGSPAHAWEILRGVHARWPDEEELRDTNAALTGVLITGAPAPTAWLALGDIVARNLALPLDPDAVKERLGAYELAFEPLAGRPDLGRRVASLTASWRAGTAAEMLDPPIPRPEASEIAGLLEGKERVILASGDAGDGKTGVLSQVVARLTESGWPVLAVRLDRHEPFRSPLELGEQLKLPASPAAVLASTAGDGPALLLIDQLDAVSLASGRMPESFGAVVELLREAAAFPSLRVLLAARRFDIENDSRLRGLVDDTGPATGFRVGRLDAEQVAEALEEMRIDPSELSDDQIDLLRSPLHLVLFRVAATEGPVPGFAGAKDLFDLFWERKARSCSAHSSRPRFTAVIDALLDAMSASQRLAAPATALDDGDLLGDADVLASEHVLVRDEGQLAFFHEAFFDYAFARRWIRRGESVLDFLLAEGQELFRRGQVRQILTHLRGEDGNRFVREVDQLLADDRVRFHIKDVVLGLMRSLTDPRPEEWAAMKRMIEADDALEDRLWFCLRSVGWFDRLVAEGVLERWLSGAEDGHRARAVDILVTAVRGRVEEVTRLLVPLRGQPFFPELLIWVARFAPVERSRRFFDLLLEASAAGDLDGHEADIWLDLHGLAEAEPAWAAELLRAYLAERPAALRTSAAGKVLDLESSDNGVLELVSGAAAGVPSRFCELLLDYLQEVMAKTGEVGPPPILDPHFGHRHWRAGIHRLDDALLRGMNRALVAVAKDNEVAFERALTSLAADDHDAAQWLLYGALAAAGPGRADEAARIILQGDHRLECGYIGNRYWTTRELLEAIGGDVSDELFVRLEAMLFTFAPDWEDRRPESRGYSSFALLSALPSTRLSPGGHRRLGELRRKFDLQEPPEPAGIVVGPVVSPISGESAEHMTDDQWLGAIARYASEERTGLTGFVGAARELAQVLEAETRKDPARFVALAMRFTSETHPAYTDAVLRTVGENGVESEPESVFALMRHVDAIADPENDNFIGDALAQHLDAEIPDDVVELILGRALNSANPAEDAWSEDRDPWSQGMNSVRGRAAERLADLLIHDAEGDRSALVAPKLAELAQDRTVAVRSSVARLVDACLRHQRRVALAAFDLLVEADDRLLATLPVEQLMIDIGRGDPQVVAPTIERMLGSGFEEVRKVGGRLAAFAGLELGLRPLFTDAASSPDAPTREGVATICAKVLSWTSDVETAGAALKGFFIDEEEAVRRAAAGVATELRGEDLDLFGEVLRSLIESPSFAEALTQLLFTLEAATGDVAELGIECAERFLSTQADEAGDIRTAAAGDSRHVGELLLRTYAQTRDAAIRERALNALDRLLLVKAFGVDELVRDAER